MSVWWSIWTWDMGREIWRQHGAAQSRRGEARFDEGRSSQTRSGRADQGIIFGQMMTPHQATTGGRVTTGPIVWEIEGIYQWQRKRPWAFSRE